MLVYMREDNLKHFRVGEDALISNHYWTGFKIGVMIEESTNLTLWWRCLSNNVIYEFSPYLKDNTALHHYKDQLFNAV
jgi:hypothetical protein